MCLINKVMRFTSIELFIDNSLNNFVQTMTWPRATNKIASIIKIHFDS